MRETRALRGRGLLAIAGAVALLAIVGVPFAVGADPLAAGTVYEKVPPGADWKIVFAINSHGSSQSAISVVAPGESFSFTPSSCSGTFTDPKLGGTTVYGVGPVTPGSYVGSSSFKVSYYGYSIHKGAGGADFSDVWGLGPYWFIYCAIPSLMSPPYAVDAGSTVTFGV
jgi:hypothetical protein